MYRTVCRSGRHVARSYFALGLRRFLDNDMRIGAADSKRAYAGSPGDLDRLTSLSRCRTYPGGPLARNGKRQPIKGNRRIGRRRSSRRHDFLPVQLQQDLDEPSDSGTRFQMSDVGFKCTQQARGFDLELRVPQPLIEISQFQTAHFNGISKCRSRSMRLDERNGPRIDAGHFEGSLNGLGLCLWVGSREADRSRPVTQAGPSNHAIDTVTVGDRPIQGLEDDNAGSLTDHSSVRTVAEGTALARRR